MEAAQPQVVSLSLEGVALHTLYAGRKMVKGVGHLELVEKGGSLWINVNHWNSHQVIKESEFHKIIYDHYVTYIFENIAGGFYAISIMKADSSLNAFEEKLKTIGKVTNYQIALESEDFRKKIQYHYPDVEKASIHNQDLFTPMFTAIGRIQNNIGERAQPQLENVSMRTRAKNMLRRGWNSMRQGFRTIDQKTDQIPGMRTTKDFVANTAEKIKTTTQEVVAKVVPRTEENHMVTA